MYRRLFCLCKPSSCKACPGMFNRKREKSNSLVESKTRVYNGRSYRRSAQRGGRARRGSAGWHTDRLVRTGRNRPTRPPEHRRQLSYTFLRKPEEKGHPKYTDGGTQLAVYPWSICGLSAVYRRFIRGTRSALHACLLTSVQTPICLCNPFSCMACGGIPDLEDADARENAMWNFMVQQLNHKKNDNAMWNKSVFWFRADLPGPKPGHTMGGSGQGGAQRSGGARPGRAGRDIDGRPGQEGSIRQGDNPLCCHPANREHCPGRNKTRG